LEGGFITKYIQICFWLSPKAMGFWLNGLRRNIIFKKTPLTKRILGELGNPQILLKTYFSWKIHLFDSS